MKPTQPANKLAANLIGHVHITDDLGNVLLDQHNAVHPQNLARIIARALANESPAGIYRVALGNGGTTVSAGNAVNYKPANDGQLPDTAGWQSRLYNETYSEIIDDQSPLLGTGLGTSPSEDPSAVPNVSGPGVRSSAQGLTSLVTIDLTLNANEPNSQLATDAGAEVGTTVNEFYFDELGLFTEGLSYQATSGYQAVNVGKKNIYSNTGLDKSAQYTFTVLIDEKSPQSITITTPANGTGISGANNYITYGDLLPLLNAALNQYGATASITDPLNNVNTGGDLIIKSIATGITGTGRSGVVIADTAPYAVNWLFGSLMGYNSLDTPVEGQLQGVEDNASDPSAVRERLLTHIIFSPILKAANRTIRIVYTLTVAVARTQEPN